MRSLQTAATGMAAQELNVEVISNNIANMNTVGFKRQRAEFEDMLYEQVSRAAARAPRRQHGAGRHPDRRRRQGRRHRASSAKAPCCRPAIRSTWRFKAKAFSGADAGRYFRLHPRRHVPDECAGPRRHPDGYLVQPGITMPANAGVDQHQRAGSNRRHPSRQHDADRRRPVQADALPQQRRPAGDRQQPVHRHAASGPPQDGIASIDGVGSHAARQSEPSNVDSVTEITNLIIAQRAYEMNSKVVTTADQMLQTTAQLLR